MNTMLGNRRPVIKTVFRNRLNTAVQHNDGDPVVTVETEPEVDSARVVVAENSPGIPEEMRDSLFERGEKGRDSSGSGLGLYLVDSLRPADAFDGRECLLVGLEG